MLTLLCQREIMVKPRCAACSVHVCAARGVYTKETDTCVYNYIYIIWDSLRENGPSLYNYKVIKMTHV